MKSIIATILLSFLLITPAHADHNTSPGVEFKISSDDASEARKNEILVNEILKLIQNKHVVEKSNKELTEGAINGMIKLLDKHSSYMPPADRRNMQESQSGQFSGIGANVSYDKDKKMITLERILPRSPAMKAGLKDGDKVWKIDDKLTTELEGERPINDAVRRMRGTTGTDVKLYIERNGTKLDEPITVTRGIIKIESVKTRVLDGNIAYMSLQQFGDKAVTEVAEALQKFADDPDITYRGLIFDLRNNPGGLLYSAISISDMFLDEGVIVSTRPRDASRERFNKATPGQMVPKDFPIVILINQFSASASEIVAGTLQDHKRATIVGIKSYGKGSVQTIIPLSNGGALRLTTAKYHTASGKTPHGVGIIPDVKVELPEDYFKNLRKTKSFTEMETVIDPQMIAAIKEVRKLIKAQENSGN